MSEQCSLCDKTARTRGWCTSHYKRWLRHGNPLAGERFRRPKGLSVEETFRWFMPGDPPAEGCWDWTAGTLVSGYGQFSLTTNDKLRVFTAHRVAYRIFNGPLPDDADVLHSCDRPICVQPAHLMIGNAEENMRQALERDLIPVGEKCSWAKLTEADVIWIRQSTLTNTALAKILRISKSHVSDIRRGRNWKHLL